MSDHLRVETRDGIRTLTLDRPGKRNALGAVLVGSLRAALADAADDPEARVIVLRGAGDDFCSGADLDELARIAGTGVAESLDDASALGRLFVDIRRHPLPILAAVHGRALAGGCGLATACDLVVASEDAELGYPEIHLGFVPAMVMAILRRKISESAAFDLVATGRRIDAREALELGLVGRVFPSARFDDGVEELAGTLGRRPPGALRLSKRLLYGLDGLGFEDGIARGAEVNALARTSEECRDGVRRFLERSGRGREGGGGVSARGAGEASGREAGEGSSREAGEGNAPGAAEARGP